MSEVVIFLPEVWEFGIKVVCHPNFGRNIESAIRSMFQNMKGVEEAVLRNIEACNDLAATVRSAYGPNGVFFKVII